MWAAGNTTHMYRLFQFTFSSTRNPIQSIKRIWRAIRVVRRYCFFVAYPQDARGSTLRARALILKHIRIHHHNADIAIVTVGRGDSLRKPIRSNTNTHTHNFAQRISAFVLASLKTKPIYTFFGWPRRGPQVTHDIHNGYPLSSSG